MSIEFLIIFFWLPNFLFYILQQTYWWQIKEYRVDRFLVHLQTDVGRRLYLSKLNSLKIITLAVLIFFQSFGTIIFLALYIVSLLKYLKDTLTDNFHLPLLTARMILTLTMILFIHLIFFLLFFSLLINPPKALVLLDLCSPFLVAISVLVVGSFSQFYKKEQIIKAEEKISALPNLLVLGITGSFGKTTTKEFISQFLSSKYQVLETPGHVNTEIGIAQFILNKLKKGTQILIVEMGAYKRGEIKAICQLVKPKIGVLTAIGNQHLSLFGSMDKTIKAKFELMDSLPEDGIAILNADDENIKKVSLKYNFKKVFFSLKVGTDIYAQNIQILPDGVKFNLHFNQDKYAVFSPIIGKQNVLNVLAALAVGLALKVDIRSLLKIAASLEVPPSTMEVLYSDGGATVIDDSYNINPQGVKLALETLSSYEGFTKIMVLSPMLELGEQTLSSYKEVLSLSLKLTDAVVCIGLDFADVFKKLKIIDKKIHFFKNTNRAAEFLKKFDKKDVVIVFEGRNSKKVLDKLL